MNRVAALALTLFGAAICSSPLKAQSAPGWEEGVAAFKLTAVANGVQGDERSVVFRARLTGIDGAPRRALVRSAWSTQFNIGMPPSVKCDVHPWMFSTAQDVARSGKPITVTGTPDGFREGVAESVSFETSNGARCTATNVKFGPSDGRKDWLAPS